MIYLDNAATTKPYNEVLDVFIKTNQNNFANSSSIHKLGVLNLSEINRIKSKILNILKLPNDYEVIFTSSATEANNLAIIGYALKNQNKGKHLITSKVEHASILNTFKYLETLGFSVSYLDLDENGEINSDELIKNITKETILVSVMSVNNEFGNLLNVDKIKEITSKFPKIAFHSDCSQSLFKTDINYKNIDMFTIAGHKIHGLKGIGALIKKKKINLQPLLFGGGQENNLRSSTYDFSNIASLFKAIEISNKNYRNDYQKVSEIFNYTVEKLQNIDEINVHTFKKQSPFILNFTLKNKKASVVVEYLSNNDIYVSSVSACSSKDFKGSYVAKALKINDFESNNTIRISFSSENSKEEIDIFIEKLKEILERIRN